MISDSFVFINEHAEKSSPLLAHYLRKAERRHLLSELDRELWFYKQAYDIGTFITISNEVKLK